MQVLNFMTNRFALVGALLLQWSVFWLGSTALPMHAAERPNVVFLFADDWGRYASVYREPNHPTINDVIETPNFDALAAGGVLFWDAHVSAPSCTPSRTAVLTGRHFFRNGSGSQLHSPWSGDKSADPVLQLKSYHQRLKEAGYHTGVTYKTHVSMHLFNGNESQYNSAGQRFNRFSQEVSAGKTRVERENIQQQLLDEVRSNMRSFLDAGQPDQPFCWYLSPTNTHRTWVWKSAQLLWNLNPDDLTGKLPPFLPDNETIRQDMADYLGECMAFDAAIGVVVDELKQRGQFENTILVVSGDHGAPGFPRGKTNLFNFGTQVPLAIHWPAGIKNPGRRIDNPTSLIDLAPTYLDAVGLEPQPGMNGNSLLPILREGAASGVTPLGNDYVITGRERHVGAAREDFLPYPSRAIRTNDYLYIRNFKSDRWPMLTPPLTDGESTHGDFDGGPTKRWFAEIQNETQYAKFVEWAWGKRPTEELYDLRQDRYQMTNLVDSTEHKEIHQKLSNQLMEILRQAEDPRVVGDDAFDRSPYLDKNGR
jgi:uncharacterized sulfatase